ncbi:MAG: hypothetical protein ABI862_08550 [Ilumatobacteraceae bacterium]
MAKLIYASNMSLDGCTEDERGALDWAPPDDDVFVSITELMRSAGTYLYGRRMFETLAVWETDATLANQSGLMADDASAWQALVAELVDELALFVWPVVLGGRTLAHLPLSPAILDAHFQGPGDRGNAGSRAGQESSTMGRGPAFPSARYVP